MLNMEPKMTETTSGEPVVDRFVNIVNIHIENPGDCTRFVALKVQV
jgi:hypothetical protein